MMAPTHKDIQNAVAHYIYNALSLRIHNEGTKVQNPRRVHCIYNVQLIYTRINIHGNIHVHTRTNA